MFVGRSLRLPHPIVAGIHEEARSFVTGGPNLVPNQREYAGFDSRWRRSLGRRMSGCSRNSSTFWFLTRLAIPEYEILLRGAASRA